jgi:hypothetical protein
MHLLLLVFAGPSPTARAQDTMAVDAKEDPKYRSTLKEALAEYDASHFEEARSLFRRAHEINPNARTLRSIGMASFELRDYVAAVHALSASLSETRKPLNAEQRTHVQGLLERSRMFVDVYTLKVLPADARMLIDGRAPEFETDGTVLLGFGTHNLEASRSGYLLRSIVVNVRGGERKELVVTMERKPSGLTRKNTGNVTSGAVTLESQPMGTRPSKSGGNTQTIWLLAAGGTALVSVGAGALWLFQNNELTDCHNPAEGLRCNNESAVKSKRNIAAGATLATGAAALTMAAIGIFSGNSKSATPVKRSAVSCAVFPSGFFCTKPF